MPDLVSQDGSSCAQNNRVSDAVVATDVRRGSIQSGVPHNDRRVIGIFLSALRRRRHQAITAKAISIMVAGSGTAPDSGSAEARAELLPGPSEAPKCAR